MLPLNKVERDWLIEQHYSLRDEYVRLYDADAPDVDQDRAKQMMRDRLQEYWDRLPRLLLSRCPFTGEPLVRAFDAWGVDGFWWQGNKLRDTQQPAAPSTLRLLQGALHLHGLPPHGGREEALVGPEVPFVIPRILTKPGMVAVISSLSMTSGYTAFPIAYYSVPVPPPGSLTQGWREQTYGFISPNGDPGWRIDADPWDFDLKPWFDAGRVKWIDPGDPQMIVREGTWDEFPYKNLPGRRERQIIVQDRLRTEPPPNNEQYEPFE